MGTRRPSGAAHRQYRGETTLSSAHENLEYLDITVMCHTCMGKHVVAGYGAASPSKSNDPDSHPMVHQPMVQLCPDCHGRGRYFLMLGPGNKLRPQQRTALGCDFGHRPGWFTPVDRKPAGAMLVTPRNARRTPQTDP